MSDIIDRIVKWNVDRLLDKQTFNLSTEMINILEELVEMGTADIESDDARKIARNMSMFIPVGVNSKENIVDSLGDIVVFSIGAMLKLGYNPQCVMNEVLKEIESRIGVIKDGKFIKDKSPKAKANWYKANFSNCYKDKSNG